VLGDPRTLALAQKYECAPPQILFRYLTQIGIVPLTGTTSEEHMRADLNSFDFALTQVESDSLTVLLQ
jgi:diketogulonate reductase-like aldo/keto reductase